MKQKTQINLIDLKSAEHFTAKSSDGDGGELGSMFVIKPAGIKRHAKRLRKAVPELDKETAEKCARVYCQMFAEDINELTVGLLDQVMVIGMQRIAMDVANLATKATIKFKEAQIKRDMDRQLPKPKKKRKRKV
jgi:hypothetical protein